MNHRKPRPIVIVIITGPYHEVVLVREPNPLKTFTFWKFPEVASIDGLMYRETAFKIVKDEIGLFISPGNLDYLVERKIKDETYLLFQASVRNFEGLKEDSDSQEILVMTSTEICDMKDVFPLHAKFFKELGLAHS